MEKYAPKPKSVSNIFQSSFFFFKRKQFLYELMGGKSIILQQKQEFSMRTRWTADLDKIYADLVVEQIQLGNRPNKFFDKKTWSHIRDEFNKQTALTFNNNQLRKHLEVLRTRFLTIKSYTNHNNKDFVVDNSCIGFGIWNGDFKVQSQHETTKIKECPIFEQLCIMFPETEIEGQYAQSSHYEELDKSLPSTHDLSVISYTNNIYPHAKKQSCSVEKVLVPGEANEDQDWNVIMAKVMLDMLDNSTSRRRLKPKRIEKFSITKCVETLDEIEGTDDSIYFAALNLFEDPNMRETFVSLKSDKIRLAWLSGKCGTASSRLS